MVPTLETSRLILRAFRAADWAPYARMSADPDVMRFIGTGGPISANDAWRSMASMLGHWSLKGYGMWAVEVKETGEFAGRVGFLDPPGWPGFEVGWVLARECWGRGYATEAASFALRYAFETLGRDRVISLIRPGNDRSIKVAERIGETLAGEVELLGGPCLVYEKSGA
jgi:RimJ/RimL family protein N-acetyltransferase